MGNLISSLATVARSMETVQKGIALTSNNVTNARAPGYVRQTLAVVGLPFELSRGLTGGLDSTGLISSRKDYLEHGVHTQQQQYGRFSQRAVTLAQVDSAFDVNGQGGVGKALDGLFASFLDLSVAPNSTSSRQGVLRQARQLAGQFNDLAATLTNARQNAATEGRATVTAINNITNDLRNYNLQIRQDRRKLEDPGLDAQIHSKLDQLSDLVDFTVLRGEDGSYNVYLGGQTPAVLGDHQYPIHLDESTGQVVISNDQGADITGTLQGGKIRGLIEAHNGLIQSHQTDLDRLATAVAQSVNAQLGAGLDRNGQPGAALFQYNATLGAAATIAVRNISPDEIAAASLGAPGGNGNALDLADFASAKIIDNQSFSQFYGEIAARAGAAVAAARDEERTHSLMLTQAKTLREELSSVSLDEEAARLVEYQRAYQASAQVFRTLNELTQTTIDLLR